MKSIIAVTLLCVITMQQAHTQSMTSKKARVKYTIKPSIEKKFTNCSAGLVASAINFNEYDITPDQEKSYQSMTAW